VRDLDLNDLRVFVRVVDRGGFAQAARGEPGANRTAYIEFQVEDVDAHYERLKDKVPLVHEMKTMPWGNKTFQFRDPEGTAVSIYMPATDAARKRFASR
jgi:uncharacterized glyoxalase superfamily protein PhnB